MRNDPAPRPLEGRNVWGSNVWESGPGLFLFPLTFSSICILTLINCTCFSFICT